MCWSLKVKECGTRWQKNSGFTKNIQYRNYKIQIKHANFTWLLKYKADIIQNKEKKKAFKKKYNDANGVPGQPFAILLFKYDMR